jgi:DNA-binding HxlR family transcriptional regulator
MESFMTGSDSSHFPIGTLQVLRAEPLRELQRRWTLEILLCVNEAAHRFVDLRNAIPHVTANALTQRLRGLEAAGLIERRFLPPPAARQVYVLAPGAADLRPALDALGTWLAAQREFPLAAHHTG